MKILPVFDLPEGDLELKKLLNYNPPLNRYTKSQPETGRDPNETDRGGWRGYNRVYSKYIGHLRKEPLKIMEIGANHGYGLLAWARYFPNSTIFSLETELKYAKQHNEMLLKHEEYTRVKINYLNSTEPYTWVQLDEMYDIIIDDGSHKPEDQVRTLRFAWPYLKNGGFYFIEDISSRYYDPSCEVVAQEIAVLESQGFPAISYKHENKGWAKILSDPKVWPRYGVTNRTPKKAEDFIAVIEKVKRNVVKKPIPVYG